MRYSTGSDTDPAVPRNSFSLGKVVVLLSWAKPVIGLSFTEPTAEFQRRVLSRSTDCVPDSQLTKGLRDDRQQPNRSRGDILLTLDVITNADKVTSFKGPDSEYTDRMLQTSVDG